MTETTRIEPGSMPGPVLNGDYADPTVICDGEDCYMTHSSGYYSPALLIWHSKNLADWEPVCFALNRTVKDLAAPELVKYGEKYFLYYPENGSNWVITAEHPEGPWSEPVDLGTAGIDPGHIAAPDGRRFLYLNDGYAAPLSKDGLSLLEKPRKVYDGWKYDDSYHTEGFFLESPKLFFRDGYYYLVSAQGGTSGPPTAHMAVVARARDPMGPWENSPYNPLMHTGSREEKWWAKGHATIFQDGNQRWWTVYHAYEKDYLTLGRKVLMEPVEWTCDGWPIVKKHAAPEITAEQLGEKAGCLPGLSDSLTDETRFRWQWRFFGRYDPARTTFSREGMKIASFGNSPGESAPMTCITGDHAYEVSVSIDRSGGAAAGLLLFYSPECYCGIELGGEGIRLYKFGKPYVLIPYDFKSVRMKLVNDHHTVIPYYSADGNRWVQAEYCFETSGHHHNSFGGYSSLRPAIFSRGTGDALFINFQYRKID